MNTATTLARSALSGRGGSDPRPSGRLRPADHLVRAANAHLHYTLDPITHGSPEKAARSLYGNTEEATALITRGVTAPATTTTSGWASQIAVASVADFVSSLAPSAAAQLINRGLRVSLVGKSSISVPR